jgi:hypothetical protein
MTSEEGGAPDTAQLWAPGPQSSAATAPTAICTTPATTTATSTSPAPQATWHHQLHRPALTPTHPRPHATAAIRQGVGPWSGMEAYCSVTLLAGLAVVLQGRGVTHGVWVGMAAPCCQAAPALHQAWVGQPTPPTPAGEVAAAAGASTSGHPPATRFTTPCSVAVGGLVCGGGGAVAPPTTPPRDPGPPPKAAPAATSPGTGGGEEGGAAGAGACCRR